jgi:two-component system nitrogen regulation sensor histidine kinase NtrY
MMRVGYPDITFTTDMRDKPVLALFDRRLISQALTNIIKNGTEAITAITDEERGGPGMIEVSLEREGRNAVIHVTDNGVGLPDQNRERLLEPYMTTREKGTGLGLAIVGRILEEHGGTITLSDAPAVAEGGRGARISLVMPLKSAEDEQVAGEGSAQAFAEHQDTNDGPHESSSQDDGDPPAVSEASTDQIDDAPTKTPIRELESQ